MILFTSKHNVMETNMRFSVSLQFASFAYHSVISRSLACISIKTAQCAVDFFSLWLKCTL